MTPAEKAEFEKQKELAIKQFENLYNVKGAPIRFEIEKEQKQDLNPIQKTKPKETFGTNFLRNFNFKNLNIDNDRLIIIAVLLLLLSDECDQRLILALVFILL